MSAQAAEPFSTATEANFDDTQQTHAPSGSSGVFQHSRESLVQTDFQMRSRDLSPYIRRVYLTCLTSWLKVVFVRLSRQQKGQSLEATLQNLDRFYEEGILGDLEQGQIPVNRYLQLGGVSWNVSGQK